MILELARPIGGLAQPLLVLGSLGARDRRRRVGPHCRQTVLDDRRLLTTAQAMDTATLVQANRRGSSRQ